MFSIFLFLVVFSFVVWVMGSKPRHSSRCVSKEDEARWLALTGMKLPNSLRSSRREEH
jgi:hypothetical protein